MRPIDFDPAVLRSFVAGIDLGSFAKAASQVGRSTSAVSAQIHRLEEQADTALFEKSGRHLRLTPAGETLLTYARRMIELNDEAAVAVRGIELDGWIRLGMQEDFGESALPDVLGRFARAHPKVRIEAHVARNADLLERMQSNQLDLALMWTDAAPDDGAVSGTSTSGSTSTFTRTRIAAPAMRWIGSAAVTLSRKAGEPLPLVAFDRQCVFQSAATRALDRAGIPWRVAFTSPSLSGIFAATAAGLGMAVRTAYGLPSTLKMLDVDVDVEAALPGLPSISLTLLQQGQSRSPTPSVDRLASIILDWVSARVPV